MKTYNRITKKYEDIHTDNINKGELKKKDTCKGKRPHTFVLTIPDYMQTSSFIETEDNVIRYYTLKKEQDAFEAKLNEQFQLLGIRNNGSSFLRSKHKYYVCSVCGKKDWE